MPRPSELLSGRSLKGEYNTWSAIERIPPGKRGSGGHFSTSYIVEDEKKNRAFLKAMDYSDALKSPDVPAALNVLTASFMFERNVLDFCRERNLDHIVRVVDRGQIDIPEADGAPIKTVNFLVFELAANDISYQVRTSDRLVGAVCLRVLHSVAVGLQQLHGVQIVHQDVRPSNILRFDDAATKLADLGRAMSSRHASPTDALIVPGFIPYSPPEFLYGAAGKDIEARRAGDLFLLGSVLFFLYTGAMLMPVIKARLAPEHCHEMWRGSYTDALPFIQQSFAAACDDFSKSVPADLAAGLTEALVWLSNPNVERRGHPRNRSQGSGSKFGLERFVSFFDRLAIHAEWELKGKRG